MKTIHTSIRIPEHIKLKLDEESLKQGIPLAKTINNHLEQGFDTSGPSNKDLVKLCHSLSSIADDLEHKDKKTAKRIRNEVRELWNSL